MIGVNGGLKWLSRVAGGVGGFYASTKFLTPKFPVDKSFLGLPMVSRIDELGWDDVVDVASAITVAGFSGLLAGRVLNGKRKKKK